jgi:hypothetical protein
MRERQSRKDLDQGGHASLNELSLHLNGENEDILKKTQSGYPVSLANKLSSTSQIYVTRDHV